VTFGDLALVVAVGTLGPLLAWRASWNIPIVLGELIAGFALGRTGLGVLHASDHTFTFLADIGFALVMFVAGTHVPVRDASLRSALGRGLLQAAGVGVLAAAAGAGIAAVFDTGHGPLYAVLVASSSAALVLPVVGSIRLGGPIVLRMLAQVAIADTACIVVLPLVIQPSKAGRAALGAGAVIGCAVVAFFVLREAERRGLRRRLHRISEKRGFALELRLNLLILFALAALAVDTHVSILLAGFAFGLVVAGIGEPRRLARQVFGVTEGFFAPLFFVWLGASLNLRDLGTHPKFIWLGLTLGLVAIALHVLTRVLGQPVPLGMLSAAQLGVPVAAATVGSETGVLAAGEAAALILGAVVTIIGATVAGALSGRRPDLREEPSPAKDAAEPDGRRSRPKKASAGPASAGSASAGSSATGPMPPGPNAASPS
jgi:Kef-type K+ transport system membrane component KefB